MSLTPADVSMIDDIMTDPTMDWMSAQILRLICKADPEYRARFRTAFPDHVELYELWHAQDHAGLERLRARIGASALQ